MALHRMWMWVNIIQTVKSLNRTKFEKGRILPFLPEQSKMIGENADRHQHEDKSISKRRP